VVEHRIRGVRTVTRLRDARGMTLVEMMIAMVVAVIISLGAFALIDFSMRRSADIAGRVDADQRGRVAMDLITRQLRSQVCQPSGTPPMVNSATNPTDATHASFFVDLTNDSDPTVAPQLHTLTYDAAKLQIVESDWTATVPSDPSVDPTYSGSPTTRVLLTDVRPIPGVPMFSYFAFGSTAPMAVPVAATNLGDISSIAVNLRVTPSRAPATVADPSGSIDFKNQVTVRLVDPNADDPHPQCA
jgi:prepilin-type N-terminal cleavage/methylation domain-containing protein